MYTPYYAMVAITCHRTIILGESSIPSRFGVFWSARETKFVGWLIGIALLAFACGIIVSLMYFLVPDSVAGLDTPWLKYAVAYLFVTYFVIRFSLVLPGTAVEDNFSFADSWAATVGNGLLLILAVTVPAFCGLLIVLGLDAAMGENEGFIYDIPYYVTGYLLLAVEVGVLSVAYKYIVSVWHD